MRLSRFRVNKGGAEARAWRFIQPARGFDIAVGNRRGFAGRLRRSDGFLGQTTLTALFRIARGYW
jgi:hypothetical protein